MLSCYQTTLLLYMASAICTLISLISVIPLCLKFGLGLRVKKKFGLLLPAFQERRTMMQMQNHARNKQNWNECLTKTFLHKLSLSFNFNHFSLHHHSMTNYQCLSHAILTQRLCVLILFQDPGKVDSFYAFSSYAVIGKVLHKIALDGATGIVVVLNSPTQPLYSPLMELLHSS